jgi:hypothetical protein
MVQDLRDAKSHIKLVIFVTNGINDLILEYWWVGMGPQLNSFFVMAYNDLVTCTEETAPGTHLFVLEAVLFLDATSGMRILTASTFPTLTKN